MLVKSSQFAIVAWRLHEWVNDLQCFLSWAQRTRQSPDRPVHIVIFVQQAYPWLSTFIHVSQSDIDCCFTGPGIFLPCPMDVDKARTWFVDLWNYSIGPYLLQLIKDSSIPVG